MRGLALRDRLAVTFALALVFVYAIIAVCAVFIVDRAVTGSVDARLSTVAEAIFTIAGDERDEIDRKDRAQFAQIVTDASGAFVLAGDKSLLLSTTEVVPDWARSALSAERAGRIFTTRNERRSVRAIIKRRRLQHATNTIVVWQSMQIVQDLERVVVLVLSGFGVAVAAGGYLVGAQIARRGLLPLTRVAAVVADIAGHDLTRRVGPQPHADELGRLAATFDRMLDRLQSAFERQRQFTADASHDLRAPLATLRAEVDLALRRERTVGEYRAALAEIAVDADLLDRLIDALLAAARADAGDVTLQPLDLGEVTRRSVDQIAPFAQASHVAIDADLRTGSEILGDTGLLERAVLATLHNAVKYTPRGAAIHVRVRSDGRSARLSILDEGPGFSQIALVHAFDRFWRDNSARGRSGTGLGLAIAHGIVQRCGGEITLDNADDGGGRVTICFPTTAKVSSGEREPV